MGTSTTTGDGGMTPEERGHSRASWSISMLPSRYGMNPDDLRKADAIEVVVGQGAKPGGGGMLLGQKITERVAEMRTTCPRASTSARPAGIRTGPGRTIWRSRSSELREITDWEKPIYVKVGAARPYYDTCAQREGGADVVVVDGMQGGTAATQEVFIEHVGIPTLPAVREAVRALQGSRHAPQGAADRLGRHPQRRGCGEGAWRWAPTPCRSAPRRWSRSATTTRRSRRNTRRSAPPPAPMTTGMRARTRPASRPRTRRFQPGSIR